MTNSVKNEPEIFKIIDLEKDILTTVLSITISRDSTTSLTATLQTARTTKTQSLQQLQSKASVDLWIGRQ